MLVILIWIAEVLITELLELILHQPSLLVSMDIVLYQQRQVFIHADMLCLDLLQLVFLSRHCVKILRVLGQLCLGLCDDELLVFDLRL